MRKRVTASQIRKLPPGTDVFLIRESTGQSGRLWVVKQGKKKMLRGAFATHEITDREGWRYEIEV